MLKQAGLLMAGLVLSGCTTTTQIGSNTKFHEYDTAQTASSKQMAATADFPSAKASDDLTATVVKDGNELKIVNWSDKDIMEPKVWVNEQYVGRVHMIPANGTTTISLKNMYDKDGYSAYKAGTKIDKVYVESRDQLYLLKGPAWEK